MPSKDPGGIIVTILLGIAGSIAAGLLGRAQCLYQPGEGAGLIMSVIGAIELLVVHVQTENGLTQGFTTDSTMNKNKEYQ